MRTEIYPFCLHGSKLKNKPGLPDRSAEFHNLNSKIPKKNPIFNYTLVYIRIDFCILKNISDININCIYLKCLQ